jgi:hypothetical protein
MTSSSWNAVPVVAQARSLSELAQNVTKISDPVSASLTASKLIVQACTPLQIKYPLKCTILLLQFGVCFSTGDMSSVTSVVVGIGTVKQILEELV